MMKTLIQITLLLSLLTACAHQETEPTGTYQSEHPNLVKKVWKYFIEGYDGFTTGTELELKTDSTFLMVTCANILTGTWFHTKDSLYLTYRTNRWRNDSLHEFGLDGKWPELREEVTEALEIHGNQLITKAVNTEEDGGIKLYNVLEKQ